MTLIDWILGTMDVPRWVFYGLAVMAWMGTIRDWRRSGRRKARAA